MKVLYLSCRLNVPDGSSVHGRAFVASVNKLGHEIVTYPEIIPLLVAPPVARIYNKNIIYYIKRLRPRVLISRLKQIDSRIANIINFIEGLLESIQDYFRLRSIIKTFHPDIIIYRKYLFNYAAVWAARQFSIPCIAEVNSLNLIESRLKNGKQQSSAIIRWAEIYPLVRTNHVFCVSEAIKQSLDTFLDSANVSVVPNGVDSDVFDRNRYDAVRVKQELGLAGKTILGYAGSYQSWHDVRKTVDVIVRLKDVEPAFHLLLVGNGHDFSTIKRHIEEQGLESSVTQIEYVPHTEMPKYLAAFDIAVMTYPIFDGFYFSPLKMYEYMAMELPVVSTDIGQIRDVIEDGRTGILVQQPTVDEFVKAILSITREKGRLTEMGKNARRTAIERHSWLVNASQVLDLCSMTLNADRRDDTARR